MLSKGLLFILSAPAGTGKTTLVEKLTAENPAIVESVSFTTRPARSGEIDGVHYHFISREVFKEKIVRSDFLEHVEFCDNFYGTSRTWVDEKRLQGMHVILTIDTQGALLLKDKIDAIYIFILPPSPAVQRQRLENRKTETSESIKKRLARTPFELQAAKHYDYAIVNDDLNAAYAALKSIIIAEEHKVSTLLQDSAGQKLFYS